MGAVYEATDGRLKGSCAVKEMLEVVAQGDNADLVRRKFAEEAAILCQLRHPGIPAVRDYFQLGATCYIVMDLVHGVNLEQELEDYLRLTGAPYPVETLVDTACQVLKILEYLHFLKPPVIHRDIKPANLIREYRTGRIKLVDFGLARSVEGNRSQTMVGTLGYCALEQMQGRAEPRSDLYSLGATMHRLLTGKVPVVFDLPPLSQDAPEVPEGLAEVVYRATRPRAEERFPDALAMRQALQRLERAPETVLAAPEAAPVTLPAQPLPGSTGSGWLVGGALGLCCLVLGIWVGQRGQTPEPSAANLGAPEPTPARSAPPLAAPSLPPRPVITPRPVATPRPTPTPRPRPAPTTRPSPLSRTVVPRPEPDPLDYPRATRPQPRDQPTDRDRAPSSARVIRWPGAQLAIPLPPEFDLKREKPGVYLLATSAGAIRELTVEVGRAGGDFPNYLTDRRSRLVEAGWDVALDRAPTQTPYGWKVARFGLRRGDEVGINQFILADDRDPVLSYSIQLVGSPGLHPAILLGLLGPIEFRGRTFVSWLVGQ